MKAWMVVVRDYELSWPDPLGSSQNVVRRYYVVSRTRKSAIRQAKMMAGYPAEESAGRAGIVKIVVLEELD